MEIGTQTGPYRIDTLMGKGGMAEVYKAWHTGLHRFEAMKVLPPQMTFDKSFVERFLNEARMAAGLQHPNIATIHTVSDADAGQPYFTMELVEGGDLADMLEARGRLSLDEALPILRQIGAALDFAHGCGLIHRDVKPANVLLKPEGAIGHVVKMVDFGIARAQEETGGQRLTKTGMIVGTPEYMSPEQGGSGARVDHRSDIYSLAVIAYEMLCGQPPFQGASQTSAIAVIMQHVRDEPLAPITLVPALPKTVNAALLRALAKNPEDRFDSCAQFINALNGAMPSDPSHKANKSNTAYATDGTRLMEHIGSTSSATSATRQSQSKMPLVAGVLVLLLGIGLVAKGFLSGGGEKVVTLSPGVNSSGLVPAATKLTTTEPTATRRAVATLIEVPDIIGKTRAQAQEIVKAKSLRLTMKSGNSEAFSAGQVMSQKPSPGTMLAKNAPVTVQISLGPKSTPAPPLAG
ncbi:MAG TPA: protein kinase, partial [Abditibacteriaceae bacterium]